MARETYVLDPVSGRPAAMPDMACPWAILKWTPRARWLARDRIELAELTTPYVPYYCERP